MWRHGLRAALLVVSLLTLTASPLLAAPPAKLTAKSVELRENLRDLWLDHIFWERNAALSTSLGETPAADVAEQRVVDNARALANSLVPYYGETVADRMFNLLAIHYTAVKEYLTASHSNNTEGKDAAGKKLMTNADEIARYMSGINPNWVKDTVRALFTAHAGHHMAQIDNFHVRNYGAEARVYVEMKKHVYMIADAMAAGIAKQFPKKF